MSNVVSNVDWDTLIPDLKSWNDGKGIDPVSWVGCEGNFRLAVAYSLLFWPSFVEHDEMVLRKGFSEASLAGFMQQRDGDKASVEAVMNHWHLEDLHHLGCADASHERLIYLGRVLKEIHSIKLANEFPHRRFVIEFDESPKAELVEYQLTFYQPRT